MFRYLRLYLHFLRFSISRILEFRVDFTFRILMDAIYYLINILFFKVLFLHTSSLGGLQKDQILIFVGSYLIVDAVDMIFLGNNLWWLPTFVQKGDLDYYLIRPISSRFFVSFRDIAANSVLNLFMAISIFIVGVSEYQSTISLFSYITYAALMLLSFILLYNIRMLFIIPVFWFHSNRGFNDIFFSLRKTMERPSGIFTGFIKKVLVTFLPFSLVISYPVNVLFNGFVMSNFLYFFAIVVISNIVIHYFWNWGLRNYSSASS